MKKNEATISVLNDLIRINGDRVTGYERTARDNREIDNDMRDAFYRMATESRSYINDLHVVVMQLGGKPVTRATISGKIYLFWLDLGIEFGGKDKVRNVLVEACSKGEQAVRQAYRQALETTDLPPDISDMVEGQLSLLERNSTIKHFI